MKTVTPISALLGALTAAGLAVTAAVAGTDPGLAPPTGCDGSVTYAALPDWARTGFTGDGSGIPHVVGADGRLIGVLFEYPPSHSSDPADRTKILWIAQPQERPGTEPRVDGLQLAAHLTETGTTIEREVRDGPGPSGINFPEPGCWMVSARWATYADTLAIPVG